MLLTMEIFRTAILLLIFGFYTVFCHPSRPLNERSTELAWQAWLLVDDQNQNKHQDLDSFTRRRITPKSVFIAPTFSPESLPACAEGYRADSMGRCIRIIKLDEEAHLEFLLEKLNEQFGNYDDDEDSQEEMPTPGPFQLNIPLGGASRPTKDVDENLDIAIVVAPTNGNFALDFQNSVKRNTDSKNHENLPRNDQPVLPLLEDTTIEPIIENRFLTDENAEKTTTTEFFTESTTVLSTETSTTTDESTTMPTTIISTSPTETTTETETTTHTDQHALFYFERFLSNLKHLQNGTEDTPEVNSTTDNNLSTTTDLTESRLEETTTPNLEQSDSVKLLVSAVEAASQKFAEKHSLHVVLPSSTTTSYETTETPTNKRFFDHFDEFLNSRGADLRGTERFIFRDTQKKNYQHHSTHESYYNHRNRDKNNLWTIPPSWTQSSQKPLVFRIRKSNGRHLLNEQIRNPREFYREVPSQEFSYFFGIDSPVSDPSRRRNRR